MSGKLLFKFCSQIIWQPIKFKVLKRASILYDSHGASRVERKEGKLPLPARETESHSAGENSLDLR